MAERIDWSVRGRLGVARKILQRHTSRAEAAAEIGKALRTPVSPDQLDKAFARHQLPTPQSFLKQKPAVKAPPAPPQHPLESQAEAEKRARLREHMEDMVQEVRELRARMRFLDLVSANREPPRILAREKSSGLREMTAIALASDWHVEEKVDPAAIAYVNEYNLAIASRRVERFFRAIIWQIEHHRADGLVLIRELLLWLGGDLITGFIHPELIENNELAPIEAILWLKPLLINGLLTLLEVLGLDQLTVVCSYGNHGRTTDKSRIVTGYANSFEWLLYNVLADHFKGDPRIRFEITPSAHQYAQVYDWKLHFHHGDEVRYNGGVGGLTVPLIKRIAKWDRLKNCDIHHIGHFHQYLDLGYGVVNGSLIGYNAYAQSIGAEPEPPQQAFYLLDSKRGKCQKTPLWVDEESPKKDIVSKAA
jgi:hypothetical protein